MTIRDIPDDFPEFSKIAESVERGCDISEDFDAVKAIFEYAYQSIWELAGEDEEYGSKYVEEHKIREKALKRTIKIIKIIHKDWVIYETEPKSKKLHPTAGEVCISVAIRDPHGTLRDAIYDISENRWRLAGA